MTVNTNNSNKTVIIELSGRIASGKTTLAPYLKVNSANLNFVDDELRMLNKTERIFNILRFVLRHPFFVFYCLVHVLKKGNTYHNTLISNLKRLRYAFEKWALAKKNEGNSVIDEGLFKIFSPEFLIKIYPKKCYKVLVIYVTADVLTRKKRMEKRLNDNLDVKESHKQLLNDPDVFSKLNDNSLNFWKEVSQGNYNYSCSEHSDFSCFVFDTSSNEKWSEQMNALLIFLEIKTR